MRYCPKCKRIYNDQKDTCDCGIDLIKNVKLNAKDPIYLVSTRGFDKDRIESVLSDYDITFEERKFRKQFSGQLIGGDNDVLVKIYVPFCEFSKARDLIIGIVSDEDFSECESFGEINLSDKDESEEMSPQKRFIWKTISLFLFLFLIWLTVAGTDYVMALIKELIKK